MSFGSACSIKLIESLNFHLLSRERQQFKLKYKTILKQQFKSISQTSAEKYNLLKPKTGIVMQIIKKEMLSK